MNKFAYAASTLAIAAGLALSPVAATAMPADIEEAVNSADYNSLDHQNGTAKYADDELIPVSGTYVATAHANIRTAPFGTIIGGTVPGQTYEVVGEAPDCMWYKVKGKVSGYVYASYLVPKADYNKHTNSNSDHGYNVRALDMKMTVSAYALNVRTAPSMNGSVIKSLPKGTEVHVTGKVLGTSWYECKVDGKTVYMSDDYLDPEFPQVMACTVDALNIRTGASTNYPVVGTLRRGDKVKVSAVENDWLKFSLDDGSIVYVADEYMAAVY